jgi:hypothetical protein
MLNPNAILVIAFCTVAGLLLGSAVWGLFFGLALVLVASVIG